MIERKFIGISKTTKRKICKNCGKMLDRIWFTAQMTEEWSWNGKGYNECTARHSLIHDPAQVLICPSCEKIIGTGFDFGFSEKVDVENN